MPTPESPDTLNDELHSHLNEIRALRLALSRLEAELEQATDPATLVRLSGAIARLSDSIVRATAAHHKLAELAEESKLQEEWARLEEARKEQLHVEQQSKQDRAIWFNIDQSEWLRRLSEAAHEAAEGNPALAKEIASSLDAYIAADDYTYPPDRYTIARARYGDAADQIVNGNNAPGEFVPYPSNLGDRDPVLQLR